MPDRKKFTRVKKRHTYKTLVIKGEGNQILYVSKLYKGTVSDYVMLKTEFPAHIHWFENKEVRIDLGFQGFATEYRCLRVRIPHKRKRVANGESNALTSEQMAYNKELASVRVVIEHCISRLKQMRFIQQTIRIRCLDFLNRLIQLAASLANFKLNSNFV